MTHERIDDQTIGKAQDLKTRSVESSIKNGKVRCAEHFTRESFPVDFSSQSSARYVFVRADGLVAGAKPCALLPLSIRAAKVI